MPRRKITLQDWLTGAGRSIASGNGMRPFETNRLVNEAHDQRVEREQRKQRLAKSIGGAALTKSELTMISHRAFREAKAQKGRDLQFDEKGVKVKVKNGYSRDHDQYTTDVIIIDPATRTEHLHIIFSESGEVLFHKWNSNH